MSEPTAEPLSEAALKAALARQCQPFTVGGFRPTNHPTASVFGGIRVAPPEVDGIANDVYGYEWAEGVYTSKLGGWPATIQSEPWWDYKQTPHRFDYVLQIGPEPKSNWAADALFLARASDDPTKWAMDQQMY